MSMRHANMVTLMVVRKIVRAIPAQFYNFPPPLRSSLFCNLKLKFESVGRFSEKFIATDYARSVNSE